MATYQSNVLQQVQTYQRAGLALLENMCPCISTFNTKFKDFQKIEANLGSVVTFDTPPRFTFGSGLVAAWQPANQLTQTLTCDQSGNVPFTFTAQNRIFNVDKDGDEYLSVFATSAVAELANNIEKNVELNIISAVLNADQNNANFGLPQVGSGPYRFYGDGTTPISSYQQLAQAITNYKNVGSTSTDLKFYIPDVVQPAIVGSGLNQFAQNRNNEDANRWEVGNWIGVDFYTSNLLPIQVAGNAGTNGDTLTVVSTNDPSGQNVTQITVTTSGTANDAGAIHYGDMFEITDTTGYAQLRAMTYIGHAKSAQFVQFRATADAAAVSSTIVLSVFPALNWAGGANQNVSAPIVAGMQISVLPSHRAGLIIDGNAGYIAMPALPDQDPFATSSEYDDATGVSIRLTRGAQFAQNQYGMVLDAIWGATIVPQYSSRVIFPLIQG